MQDLIQKRNASIFRLKLVHIDPFDRPRTLLGLQFLSITVIEAGPVVHVHLRFTVSVGYIRMALGITFLYPTCESYLSAVRAPWGISGIHPLLDEELPIYIHERSL